MMLRVSVEMQGGQAALDSIVDPGAADQSGISHARELVEFAEAVVRRDAANLDRLRRALLDAVGPECFVDAVTVVGNFERMVRIADSTGIPLDAPVLALSADVRERLGIDRFGSAANSPALGPLGRLAGRAFGAVAPKLLSLIARRYKG